MGINHFVKIFCLLEMLMIIEKLRILGAKMGEKDKDILC
jgi:hypothetical protein